MAPTPPKKIVTLKLGKQQRPEQEDNDCITDSDDAGGEDKPISDAGADEDKPVSDAGDQDKEVEKKDDDEDGEKKENKKSPKSKEYKMSWTAEKDRKILLVMITDSDKVKGEEALQVLANTFREKPTWKALQVHVSKLREEGRAATASLGNGGASQPPANGPAPTPTQAPTTADPTDPVFEGSGVNWADLPEDLRDNVNNAVSRLQQEQDWQALQPAIFAMHRRNYATQLARETAEEEIEDAAGVLLSFVDDEDDNEDSGDEDEVEAGGEEDSEDS